jgi:hypothetical protein
VQLARALLQVGEEVFGVTELRPERLDLPELVGDLGDAARVVRGQPPQPALAGADLRAQRAGQTVRLRAQHPELGFCQATAGDCPAQAGAQGGVESLCQGWAMLWWRLELARLPRIVRLEALPNAVRYDLT